MSIRSNLTRAAVELGIYAAERHAGFELHQGPTPRQPEERDRWIRGILRGLAEVTGTEPDQLIACFDQQLEKAKGCFAVAPLPLSGQRHVVQALRWYADDLEGLDGDQRQRAMEVKRLLEDFAAYLGWDVSHTGVYPARDEVETRLLRMTARRPIRFTRVVVGGDLDPGGIELMPGLVNDADGVRRAQVFRQTVMEHPERSEWPALCTVYLGGGRRWALDVIDADELDMAVIREAGDQFLKRPGVTPVSSRELRVPVRENVPSKNEKHVKRKKMEVER